MEMVPNRSNSIIRWSKGLGEGHLNGVVWWLRENGQ